MPQTTVSVHQARETAQTMGDLTASAIHHLADALDLVSQDGAVEWRTREVRELADAIVELDVPAPSCDAPSCDCADGEDCRANAAADDRVIVGMDYAKEGLVTSAYIHKDGIMMPIPLKHHDLTARVSGDGASIALTKGALGRCFLVQELWNLPDVLEPLATMSGIQSRLDALAKRLPDPDAHMVRVVMPSEVDRDCDLDTETWFLDRTFDGHRAPFEVGDAVTDSSAYLGIHEVLSIQKRVSDGAIALKLKRHLGFVFDREAF